VDNVFRLRTLISSAEQNHKDAALQSAIHPIPSANMNPQLGDAVAYGFAISKVPRFDLPQPCRDSNPGDAVAQAAYPIGVRLPSVSLSIADDLDHGLSVA